MKKLIICLFAVIAFNGSFAQKNYEKSATFDEFDGWTKLLQLRNGNTGMIEITQKEGANFSLFDASRKKIMSAKIPLKQLVDKLKYAQIEGVYDIAGDFVVFIVDPKEGEDKRKPFLYRVILSGTNGELKSEELIGDLEMNMGVAFAAVFGDMDVPGFFIEKDPESDYYAIIKYNSPAKETIDRIEVIHCGPDHKTINKAKYNTPTDKYKFTKYLSGYVHGADYVLIGTHAFNTTKSGGDEARFYVAQLNKGKTQFVQKELAYTEFTKSAEAYFVYNKPKEFVNMFLVVDNKVINQNINPTTLSMEKPYNPDFTKVNAYIRTKMEREKEKDFRGVTEGMFVDKSGNLTFLFQEISKEKQSSGFGMPAQVVGTIFGDVALITMSPDGKEVSSCAFPCKIFRKNDHDPFAYNNARKGRKVNGGLTPVADNDWYYGMDFVSTDNASYIFFNNTIDNMEKPENKEAGMIRGISGTNGVQYTYKSGALKKDFLFGTPQKKKECKFINPGASDYNQATKTYCTVMTDPDQKQSRIVWFKLD